MKNLPLIRISIFFFVVLFSFQGCSTGYYSNSIGSGFEDSQISPDTFEIVFSGNGYTSRQKCDDMALLRASDIALNNGFSHFKIIQRNKGEDSYTHQVNPASVDSSSTSSYQGTLNGNNYYGSGSSSSTSTFNPAQGITFTFPKTQIVIKCFKSSNPDAFNASTIKNQMMKKYNISSKK